MSENSEANVVDHTDPNRAPHIRAYTKPIPKGAKEFKRVIGCTQIDWAEWTTVRGKASDGEVIVGRDGSKRVKLWSILHQHKAAPDLVRSPKIGPIEASATGKEALRKVMRASLEQCLPGIADIALHDPDARTRIKACEFLARYGIGERLEVDQNVAPAVVLMIAQSPDQPGWPSMVSVEPERPRLPESADSPQAG